VCTSSWTHRCFCSEKRKFDDLHPKRDRKRKTRLNQQQQLFLMGKFFGKSGDLTDLCKKHLLEYAGISNLTYNWLSLATKRVTILAGPLLPLTRLRQKSSSLSISRVGHVKDWMYLHSLPDPHVNGGRFFPTTFSSYRKVYEEYKRDHPKGTPNYLCWESWRCIRLTHCPNIKVLILFDFVSFLVSILFLLSIKKKKN